MPADHDDDASLTVREFAAREKMAVSQYYKLDGQGLGPNYYLNGNSRRITPEEHRAWRQRMVARTKAERNGGAK